MRTTFTEKALKILGDNGTNASNLVLLEECMQQIVPFVGAGLSVDFGYPLWSQFLQKTADEFGFGIEVATRLAKGQYEEVAEVLTRSGPRRFSDILRLRFDGKGLPQPLGKGAVRHIPRIARGLVITTNFDRVLERAFTEAGRNVDAFPGTQIERASFAVQMDEQVLLKLHGDYSTSESRVLTLSEYARAYGSENPHQVDFKLSLPSILAQALGAGPFLFLGCSLKGDRTTLVIAEIAKRLTGVMHFALLSGSEDTPDRVKQLYSWGIRPLFFPEGRFEKIDQFLSCLADTVSTINLTKGSAALKYGKETVLKREASLLRDPLKRIEQLIQSPRFAKYGGLILLVTVGAAATLAWRGFIYANKSTNDNVKVELARIPELRLAILSTATALELQIRNVGEEPARDVTIEGVAWQTHTTAQALHKVYSEQEIRPQAEISLYQSSTNMVRSEEMWGIWGRTDSQLISGYFVVTCQNCGHYRAWAFNGSAPGQFSSWPLAEFKYPEDTPRIGQCVDFPMGSCGQSEQIWAVDHAGHQTGRPPSKSEPEVTFNPLK